MRPGDLDRLPRDHTKLAIVGRPLTGVIACSVFSTTLAVCLNLRTHQWGWAIVWALPDIWATAVLYHVLTRRDWQRHGYPDWVRKQRGWDNDT